MDSGFRRNDGEEWIPAFAGMTSHGAFRRNDGEASKWIPAFAGMTHTVGFRENDNARGLPPNDNPASQPQLRHQPPSHRHLPAPRATRKTFQLIPAESSAQGNRGNTRVTPGFGGKPLLELA